MKHTITWLRGMGKTGHEAFIPCEMEGCGGFAVDVHHLKGRIGKDANNFENLCGLCRSCHDWAHESKANNDRLKEHIHRKRGVT